MYALRPGLYTPRPGLNALRPGLYALRPGLNTLRPGLYALRSGLYALRPGLNTLRLALYTLRPSLNTLRSALYTLRPSLNTLPRTTRRRAAAPFLYRDSPAELVPSNENGWVMQNDPALIVPGMSWVLLDAEGKLLELRRVAERRAGFTELSRVRPGNST